MQNPLIPRAAPPRAPKPTRSLDSARQTALAHRTTRAAFERTSILRGLLIVVALILLFSIARAGLARTFIPGWWRW